MKRDDEIRKAKKVLLLTLGTGNLFFEEKNQNPTKEEIAKKIEESFDDFNRFAYRKTYYMMENGDNDGLIESEFIAVPLCIKVKPDYAMVIGTVKSSWAGFYRKFCINRPDLRVENISNMIELNNMQLDYGIGTTDEELFSLQERVNKIFENTRIPGSDTIPFQIVLTQYGVTEEQLKSNYEIISNMFQFFEANREECYEITFDITHSFRSMPLYNFIILNYLRHIKNYNIEIKHIYYGNFESIRETKEYFQRTNSENAIISPAPVVDLKNLANVLELSEAVNEFKNTGSLISLTKNFEKNGLDNLKVAFEGFHLATQLNGFDRIYKSIGKLKTALLSSESSDNNNYVDLKKMIIEALNNDLNIEEEWEEEEEGLEKCKKMATFQLTLTSWYYKQNRFGIALATGVETLKSILVFYYLKYRPTDIYEKNFKDEKKRKKAETIFIEYMQKKKGEGKNFIELFEKIKKLRNSFAHNLMGKDQEDREWDSKNLIEISELIKTFLSYLHCLLREETFESKFSINLKEVFYEKRIAPKRQTPIVDYGKRIRILFSKDYEKMYQGKYEEFLFKSNKFSYRLYLFQDEIREVVKDVKSEEDIFEVAHGLKKYLQSIKLNSNIQSIGIVFDGTIYSLEESIYQSVLSCEDLCSISFYRNIGDRMIPLNLGRIRPHEPEGISFSCHEFHSGLIEKKSYFRK